MFAILWFLFVGVIIAVLMVWMIDNNGTIIINWLDYELQTDVLTAIVLALLAAIFIFAFSYLLARILALKFPNLRKLFFKKNYLKRLENIIKKYHRGFTLITELMLALESGDEKSAHNLHKKFAVLIKNPALNNFFSAKISFQKQEFSQAVEFFSRLGDNKNARIMVLKAKFKLALKNQDEAKAVVYSRQILSLQPDNFEMMQALFALYKKRGSWQEIKALIAEYGLDKFKDELQKRDIAVINSALAAEAYKKKQFLEAIKHANIALKAENNFLPAQEIILKSWIKLGFAFRAGWKIKNLWQKNPHLILVEIFDLVNRKTSAKNRLRAVKNLVKINDESGLEKLAIGLVAFKAGLYQTAKEFLYLALLRRKTYHTYKILAFSEKFLGNFEDFKENLAKAEMFGKSDYYLCNSCGHSTLKWSARCISCAGYDSLEWSL
jgi:uncharacterized membrane-anchored protein